MLVTPFTEVERPQTGPCRSESEHGDNVDTLLRQA